MNHGQFNETERNAVSRQLWREKTAGSSAFLFRARAMPAKMRSGLMLGIARKQRNGAFSRPEKSRGLLFRTMPYCRAIQLPGVHAS
jgi:hypothetical protein